MSYEAIKQELQNFRFDVGDLDFRAGSYGAALVYVDVRAYQTILDEYAPNDWQEGKPELLANTFVKDTALVSVIVPLTIAGRTEYGVSDFKTPTAARAQALKRAAASHGLGEYLYDTPELRDAFQNSKLAVSKSSLVAQLYEHWGLDLPDGYVVEQGAPRRQQSRQQPQAQAQVSGEKVGAFTSKQAYKLSQLGLSDEEIARIPANQARDVMDEVFQNGATADDIRSTYLAARASKKPRW